MATEQPNEAKLTHESQAPAGEADLSCERPAEAHAWAGLTPRSSLVSLAAMLSPLTLMWSVLVLVLSNRPLFTGLMFFLGALLATLAIGLAAAFVVGDLAASHHPSSPHRRVRPTSTVTWSARTGS
jgi:hypothetical protein